MADTVSDALVARLAAWGVRRIYGYPGDGINGVLGALDRAADKIEFIEPRHEEAAAFMACGHAKFSGEVGVCLATSGPGAVHLLTGLYDAKGDHQPVVAIVGQKTRASLGADFQQEIDLVSIQGCRARVRADGDHASADATRRRSRVSHRTFPSDAHMHRAAAGHPGGNGRQTAT